MDNDCPHDPAWLDRTGVCLHCGKIVMRTTHADMCLAALTKIIDALEPDDDDTDSWPDKPDSDLDEDE